MPQNDKYEFHFLGSLREDLDGGSSQTGFFPLEDIGDTRTSPVFGYVYEAHFDINYLFPLLKQIRIGRQSGERDIPVFFDGLTVDMEPFSKTFFTLYGGLAFHFFEINYTWGSDFLFGTGVDYLPFSSTMFGLDYLFVKDEFSMLSGTNAYNHLFALKFKNKSFSFLKPMIKLRFMNLSFQDLLVSTVSSFPDIDLEVSTRQIIRNSISEELSTEFTAFNYPMGSFKPFYSFDGKVRKLFGENLILDSGFFIRGLLGNEISNIFNREYSRIYSVIEQNDILLKGLFFSVTGDLWLGGNNNSYSAGLDFGYTFQNFLKDTKVSFGTYFSLYKYAYYPEPEEREMVRTFFAKAGIPFDNNLSLHCSYEFETGLEPYHNLRIETRYDY